MNPKHSNKLTPVELKALWTKYKQNPSIQNRNVLIEYYRYLVQFGAERVHGKLPKEVQLDDLISAGNLGLFDAIEGFDLERGIKFDTFAAPRIRGAILDELRAMDWVPRLVRSRSTKLDAATKSLECQLGRTPTDEELATHMNVSQSEFEKIQSDGMAVGVVSLSRKYFETDSNKDVREIDVLEDRKGVDPTTNLINDFSNFFKGMNRAEKIILALYYVEEMTMKEIGATLDLSESRVSQMHSSIIARLRAQNVVRNWRGRASLEPRPVHTAA